MRAKPICHINLASHYRGGERQTELLIRELAEQGWEQRLVVRNGHELARRCADVYLLDIRQVSPNPVAAGVAARGSSLVHAHEARGVYSGWLASGLFGIPYVFTRRVVNPQKPSLFRDRSYAGASCIVAVSEAAATAMQATSTKVAVITDAHAQLDFDSDNVDAIRERFTRKKLIGHVGALDDSAKGQRTLFEVARAVEESHPDWQFLLLGDGRDEVVFREETEGLSNVHLEGFVDNVGDYLQAMDLFVFPSVHEAVGSTLLDAMQSGLPIVASRVGGIPEIIEDGRNGLLVEPRDAKAFESAIASLLDDEPARDAMSRANKDDANKYAADQMAAAYVDVYRDVINAL